MVDRLYLVIYFSTITLSLKNIMSSMANATVSDALCPICYASPTKEWRTNKARYTQTENHSWHNVTCDAHGICWECLAKHIEVQVMSEGKCSIRCPGERCSYHLLQEDVRHALEKGESQRAGEVLDTLARLRNQSCQDRLKELAYGRLVGENGKWLMEECQPCPQCFVLSRRETGCPHIVCRCGCDFCFQCGAPNHGHEEAGCICPYLDLQGGKPAFAAWLRSAYSTPCEWLREDWSWEEPSHFVTSLGFWLWLAGVEIQPPSSWTNREPVSTNETLLPELSWVDNPDIRDDDDMFYDFYFDLLDGDDFSERELSCHVRKEIYTMSSRRMMQRVTARQTARLLSSRDDMSETKAAKHKCTRVSKRCHRQQRVHP